MTPAVGMWTPALTFDPEKKGYCFLIIEKSYQSLVSQLEEKQY